MKSKLKRSIKLLPFKIVIVSFFISMGFVCEGQGTSEVDCFEKKVIELET